MKAIIIALAAVALAGCTVPRDEFHNEVQPWAPAINYEPIRHFETTPAALVVWCWANKGTLSGDRQGCAVDWDALTHAQQPCTEAVVAGLEPAHARSVRRFLDSVCNGWRP